MPFIICNLINLIWCLSKKKPKPWNFSFLFFTNNSIDGIYMSLVTRKPVIALWEQQRRRSACASVQSDQHLCCSLPRQYNIPPVSISKISSLQLHSLSLSLSLSIAHSHSVYLQLGYSTINVWHMLLQELLLCTSLFHSLFFMSVCVFHIVLFADLQDKWQLNSIRSLYNTCTWSGVGWVDVWWGGCCAVSSWVSLRFFTIFGCSAHALMNQFWLLHACSQSIKYAVLSMLGQQ